MESPKALVEAAKPGPPLNEKEIKKFLREREPKFKPGYEGPPATLPSDYATREPRKVHTPGAWRKVGIEETGETFCLVELVSRVRLTLDQSFPNGYTENLTLTQALERGQRVEDTLRGILQTGGSKSPKKRR